MAIGVWGGTVGQTIYVTTNLRSVIIEEEVLDFKLFINLWED